MPPAVADPIEATSADTGATSQESPTPSGGESEARSTRSPSLFERLFHVGGASTADARAAADTAERAETDAPEDTSQEDASTAEPAGESEATEPSAQAKTLTLTEDELERRIQSETDRREARRQREAQAREDPVVGQQVFVEHLLATYDQATIDPLIGALPDAERAQILAAANDLPPIEGRQAVTTAALKAFERVIRADEATKAETRLRNNPAFRKQVVLGDRDADVDGDPDVLPNGAARTDAVFDMNTAIRAAASRATGRGTARGARINPFAITADD